MNSGNNQHRHRKRQQPKVEWQRKQQHQYLSPLAVATLVCSRHGLASFIPKQYLLPYRIRLRFGHSLNFRNTKNEWGLIWLCKSGSVFLVGCHRFPLLNRRQQINRTNETELLESNRLFGGGQISGDDAIVDNWDDLSTEVSCGAFINDAT